MEAAGWRFQPSDDFLVKCLLRIASGRPVNLSPYLANVDLYGFGKEPWNLFSGDDDISEISNVDDAEMKLREKYVISRIVRTGGNSNISRTAGAGTWLDKGKTVAVGEMGIKKTDLRYEYWGGDEAAAGKRYYYLQEFQLSHQALQQLQIPNFDVVLCKVHKDLSKSCRIVKRSRKCDVPLPSPLEEKLSKACQKRKFDRGSPLPLPKRQKSEKDDDPVPVPEDDDSNPFLDLDLFHQKTAACWKYLTETPVGSDYEPEVECIFADPSRMWWDWEGLLSDDGIENF